MSTAHKPREQRLVLYGVPWKTYTRLLHTLEDRHLRITYDRGALEITTLSLGHERWGRLLARFVQIVTEELNRAMVQGGSTTFRRRKKQRGLEPDDCFWIQHESAMRNKTTVDLRVDPPPDLGLEIDISRSSLNRMNIFRALRVPEIWRYDGTVLEFNILQPDGKYAVAPESSALPGIKSADLLPFLNMLAQLGESEVVRQFRAWVRQTLLPGGTPP